ncbi:MAG: diguanylate cyclase [Gemmatimonadaceae bacterium]|nr:diguanylate cyclase [Gemmatimonadaceae bacterium]
MSLPASVPTPAPSSNGVLIAGVLTDAVAQAVAKWAGDRNLPVRTLADGDWKREGLRSALPAIVVLGAAPSEQVTTELLRQLKADSRLQTVPAVVAVPSERVADWFAAGADEVITSSQGSAEIEARLTAALRRSTRDIQVNPSTRLTGADAIADAIAERVGRGELFAACYADLDHFKEFNDRYGYARGDEVIRTVAELLVEVVDATAGASGFVGHIGGDDFLFLVPLGLVAATCDTLVRRADETLPQRYSAHDRQAGYFFGKDRRGRLDRVPLMTLSIGVVTNERRRFTTAAQVSELATAMKTYAKTLPGSVWAMDRRSDGESGFPPEEKHP